MSPKRTTFANVAVVVGSSAVLLLAGPGGLANADPASPLPIDNLQAPGLPAVQSLGPVIQQAAADPTNAASMLMAAAAAFAGNSLVPTDSKNVASAVNSFVAEPAAPVAHVPAPGAVPSEQAHLPAGVDPAHAAGPALEAAPEAAPAHRSRTRAGPGSSACTGARASRRTGTGTGTGTGGCPGGQSGAGSRGGVRARKPADAGLHVPVDQQRVPPGWRQRHRHRDLGGRTRQDPDPWPRPRPDRLRVHRGRHPGPGGGAEAAAQRHLGELVHRQVG